MQLESACVSIFMWTYVCTIVYGQDFINKLDCIRVYATYVRYVRRKRINESPENLPINPAVENSIDLGGLPATIDFETTAPLAFGSNPTMYSDEDIRAIILAARLDFIEQSTCSMSNTNMSSTGSTESSEILQDLCDIQSTIEIDLINSDDNTTIETRRVSAKEYTIRCR